MKRSIFLFGILLILISTAQAQTWVSIASDAAGDGSNSSLLDGTQLEYWYDDANDSLWFRITTNSISAAQSRDIGFNLMVNYTGGGTTFNFWGSNNSNAFHKLVTGWVTGNPPSSYSGTIGIADASGVSATNYNNLIQNNLNIRVDVSNAQIYVGMKRTDLIPNSAMGTPILTAAAVGASTSWNDDIYASTGSMTLTSTVSTNESYSSSKISIYPNPAKNRLNITGDFSEHSTLTAIDMHGRQFKLQSNDDVLDLSDLEAGTYYLQIRGEDGELLHQQVLIKH